jgi:hypothetical protein
VRGASASFDFPLREQAGARTALRLRIAQRCLAGVFWIVLRKKVLLDSPHQEYPKGEENRRSSLLRSGVGIFSPHFRTRVMTTLRRLLRGHGMRSAKYFQIARKKRCRIGIFPSPTRQENASNNFV